MAATLAPQARHVRLGPRAVEHREASAGFAMLGGERDHGAGEHAGGDFFVLADDGEVVPALAAEHEVGGGLDAHGGAEPDRGLVVGGALGVGDRGDEVGVVARVGGDVAFEDDRRVRVRRRRGRRDAASPTATPRRRVAERRRGISRARGRGARRPGTDGCP